MCKTFTGNKKAISGYLLLSFFFFFQAVFAEEKSSPITIKILNDNADHSFVQCEKGSYGTIFKGKNKNSFLKLSLAVNSSEKTFPAFFVTFTNEGMDRPSSVPEVVSYSTRSTVIKIPLYPLKDDYPYAINEVQIKLLRDDGEEVVEKIQYRLFRSVWTEKGSDDSQDCMTMLRAQKISGPISNNTTSPRTVLITDTVGQQQSRTSGRTLGWSMSGNLFNMINLSGNLSWFQNRTLGIQQSSSMTIQTIVNPGERYIMLRQMTLFEDEYQIYSVNACGEKNLSGSALYHYSAVTYPVARIIQGEGDNRHHVDIQYDQDVDTCREKYLGGNIEENQENKIFVSSTQFVKPPFVMKVDDPFFFNHLGEIISDRKQPEKERKNKFFQFLKKIFH
jgi:hypothetical protein